MNEIVSGVFLGNYASARDKDSLQSKGITHILIVASEFLPQYPADFSYHRLPIEDGPGQDVLSQFETTNGFISQALTSGGKVLVHCRRGMSRSATVVLAYVMNTLQVDLRAAMSFVRKRRPSIAPNAWFVEQLRVYECRLSSKRRQKSVKGT
jgi:protein-tyrosine phosphatase